MTAATDKGEPRELKRFGWQGIVLTVPEGWELTSTQGGYQSGYFGLADQAALRLEAKWDAARPKQGPAEPSEVAERYLKALRKKAKKDGAEITVRRDTRLCVIKGKEIECYEWTAGTPGVGMASRCDECDRMVHVIVAGRAGEPFRKLARTIFASLQDHPEGDGDLAWEFYDVEFRSPPGLPLERQELKTGCIRMQFAKGSRELEFVRVSLANAVLRGKELAEWFEGFYGPSLKRMRYEVEQAPVKDHPGVRAYGRAWLVTNPGALFGKRRETRVVCWHCEGSNRLFLVRRTAPRGEEDLFSRAVDSVKCCLT